MYILCCWNGVGSGLFLVFPRLTHNVWRRKSDYPWYYIVSNHPPWKKCETLLSKFTMCSTAPPTDHSPSTPLLTPKPWIYWVHRAYMNPANKANMMHASLCFWRGEHSHISEYLPDNSKSKGRTTDQVKISELADHTEKWESSKKTEGESQKISQRIVILGLVDVPCPRSVDYFVGIWAQRVLICNAFTLACSLDFHFQFLAQNPSPDKPAHLNLTTTMLVNPWIPEIHIYFLERLIKICHTNPQQDIRSRWLKETFPSHHWVDHWHQESDV